MSRSPSPLTDRVPLTRSDHRVLVIAFVSFGVFAALGCVALIVLL